jgi:hypothetical protein
VLVFALSTQRGIDKIAFPIRPTPDDREIFLLHSTLLHQQAESACGRKCFRYEDQAAGLAVEPIHNRNLAAAGDLECE